ncbi:uncharacterized protein LOC107790495 isoform X2 [Nicotiana tabacum]|uniref:Uncharacterized protein LOC107790495 isoform X2 n=2 Tax=Nicotiana tabacum TaxID=4097 RepID=A0AC58RRT1_TOBAC|nr:PREDICTED: 1,2-dihydroxy-3-keto-5-methylthiopentene dioxygenase 2-like isoform X2 [Nicotiana tabacum]
MGSVAKILLRLMRRSPCDISTTLSANEPFLSIVSANEPFLSIVSTNEPFVDAREEVIQAWDMDDSNEDQRLPQSEPNEFVSLDKLAQLGLLSW